MWAVYTTRLTEMQKEWQQALGKMTYGIYVLTTSWKEEINGMIASWVSQVSYEPPLVMAAIHKDRYSHSLIEKGGHFALHVLAKKQSDYLERFKGPDPVAKFASIEWAIGKSGCPILKDSVAYIECEAREILSPGNHTLFIGEIKDAGVFSDEEILSTLDFAGTYTGKA